MAFKVAGQNHKLVLEDQVCSQHPCLYRFACKSLPFGAVEDGWIFRLRDGSGPRDLNDRRAVGLQLG